ncbi:glutamate-5-semialdehyde dehydrogenase [Streptococcus sanguinis]|uniref:glutamate-5-semialdehyde dehydrogenase n=1 Tax=Streptococcus sanguinis TaxID=1305 RepID=UPI000F65C8DD|nr:glutamate-5-semialdehyde dehydrogenase [Streptococcus sanguinis]RSI25204.1 Gamma-glutamyl phosphate reductase [Streptococcus sanguinis]
MTSTQAIFEKVQKVKKTINTATTAEKNHALEEMAKQLWLSRADILAANELDMTTAKGRISDVMLDRLYLDEERIAAMAEGIRQLIDLEDPVGQVLERTELDNGLVISKKRVAMGVIGIIYESRPNVTSDAAALALKSGSAVVLRSGKDAYQTALAIVTALKKGLAQTTISPDCIQLVSDTSRASAQAMMKAKGYLDLLIPRGGAGLIQAVVENATVPVIETGTGIVHVYVDKDADQDKALAIIENAKTSRPSVCNAMEVLLVHEEIAAAFLPRLQKTLVTDCDVAQEKAVELRLDEKAAQYISGSQARPEDFDTEFLDYILAVKLVSSLEEAVEHIETHSTHHSDAIVTENDAAAAYFTEQVDSAVVYVNASTRFTDGGQFGLGCEMGISTQKLHARGPMGLKELTSYKYVIQGTGQVRK